MVEMCSIWTENISLPQFKQLNGNKKTDVLIIGGGMAGIWKRRELTMHLWRAEESVQESQETLQRKSRPNTG